MGANLVWFIIYLINRKQYICINNDGKTNEQKVTCGVTQGFLVYVNDLPISSNLLNTRMFGVDANLLFEHKYISVLFSKVNRELQNINEWFISSKLSFSSSTQNGQTHSKNTNFS